MQGKSEDLRWDLEGESWRQEDDVFILESRGGVQLSEHLTDWDYLAGAHRRLDGAGWLPRQFQYSPTDGMSLPRVATQSMYWLPPCASNAGNRVCDGETDRRLIELLARLDTHWQTSGRSMQQSAEQIKPPLSSGLSFFCADIGGYRDALFALSRSGALWLWQRGSRQWLPFRPEGALLSSHAFEHWAFSAVILPGRRGSDLVLADDGGAGYLCFDPVRLTYSLDRHPGKALGAPGKLGDAVLVPLLHDGRLQLAVRRPDSRWQTVEVEIETVEAKRHWLLAAPVVTVNGQGLLWIGEHGWLLAQALGNEFEARWNTWPADRAARPILGPPFRDGEGDWQLAFGDGKWRYMLLGATLPTEHVAPRAAVSTGRNGFQLNISVRPPWKDFDHDLHRLEYVRHSFLESKAATNRDGVGAMLELRVKHRGTLTSFYESSARVFAEYGFTLPMVGGDVWHCYQLNVAKPWLAQWFVHDEALWLWIDEPGRLLRWSVA
jgi:hypothetical protein